MPEEPVIPPPSNPGTMMEDAFRLEVMRKLDHIVELLTQLLRLERREAGSGQLGHD